MAGKKVEKEITTVVQTTTNKSKKSKTLTKNQVLKRIAAIERYHTRPGIFQMPRGTGRGLDVTYELSNGGSLRVLAPKPLTPYDLTMLCVILENIVKQRKTISKNTKGELATKLYQGFQFEPDNDETKICLVYETSYYALIKDMNLDWHGSMSIKYIKDSLLRLSSTTLVLNDFKIRHIISYADTDVEKLTVAINPVMAGAVIGGEGHYFKIEMNTFLNLSPQEKLLYIQLCAQIEPGKCRHFTRDELREILYGRLTRFDKINSIEKQEARAKKALIEFCQKKELKNFYIEKIEKNKNTNLEEITVRRISNDTTIKADLIFTKPKALTQQTQLAFPATVDEQIQLT